MIQFDDSWVNCDDYYRNWDAGIGNFDGVVGITAPDNFQFNNSEPFGLAYTWGASQIGSWDTIATYKMCASTDSNFDLAAATHSPPTTYCQNNASTAATFSNVPSGNYYGRVMAVATGGFSSPVTIRGPDSRYIPPAPANLSMDTAGNYSLDYSWDSVAGASGYKMCASTSSGFNLSTATHAPPATFCQTGGATSAAFNDMSGATNYYAKVAVYDNTSGDLGTVSGEIGAHQPVRPTVTGLAAGNGTPYQLAYTWSAVVGTTNYRLYVSTTNGFNPNTLSHAPPNNFVIDTGTTNSHTITGMLGGVNYYARVIAEDDGQFSNQSSQLAQLTTLPAVSNFTSPSQDDHSLTWSWDAASGASNYRLYVSQNSNPTGQSHSPPVHFIIDVGAVTDYTLTSSPEIPNGTDYYASIAVFENGSQGPVSNAAGQPFQAREPNITGFSGTGGDNAITYTWNQASNANTDYRLIVVNQSVINTVTPQHNPPYSFVYDISDAGATVSQTVPVENGINYHAKIANYSNNLFDTDVSSTGPDMALPASGDGFRGNLNDTGVYLFADNASNDLLTEPVNFMGQDGSRGRDPLSGSVIAKESGQGAQAFDMTKLDATGAALSNQAQTWSDAGSEAAGTQWSCVRDNVTSLTWQMRRNKNDTLGENLHDADDVYTWYTSGSNNGGDGGYSDRGDFCFGYSAGTASTHCNTEAYVARVNAAALCGFTDWRLPSLDELNSIIYFGQVTPAIDDTIFANTNYHSTYWTASPSAIDSDQAWAVRFEQGAGELHRKRVPSMVRLVRGTQVSNK